MNTSHADLALLAGAADEAARVQTWIDAVQAATDRLGAHEVQAVVLAWLQGFGTPDDIRQAVGRLEVSA